MIVSASHVSPFTSLPSLFHFMLRVVPAGRAAQRLQELLSVQDTKDTSASTIHRLLGYHNREVLKRQGAAAKSLAEAAGLGKLLPEDGADALADLDLGRSCQYNSGHPLPDSKYLVDEVSMMDTPLAAALFNALTSQLTNARQVSGCW